MQTTHSIRYDVKFVRQFDTVVTVKAFEVQIKEVGCFDLDDYIAGLKTLPTTLPIILDTPEEQLIWQSLRFRYQALHIWLRHLLLGEALAPEAIETDMKYYQPHAEISAALFRLAVAVHPCTECLFLAGFRSPVQLWFLCELFFSEALKEETGLSGNPKIRGKRATANAAINFINLVLGQTEQAERLILHGHEAGTPLGFIPINLLEQAAFDLAQKDPQFNLRHFRPYLKIKRHSLYQIRDCKEFQLVSVQAGKLFVTGKNRKLAAKEIIAKSLQKTNMLPDLNKAEHSY